MARVELTWIGRQRYLGVDSTGHSVVLSSPDDIGVKPSDTLLLSLASCAAHDVVEILAKQRARLDRLWVEATGHQAPEAPWAYTRIHLRFNLQVSDVRPEQLHRAIDLSLNKYCSVRASLDPSIEVTFDAEMTEPAG